MSSQNARYAQPLDALGRMNVDAPWMTLLAAYVLGTLLLWVVLPLAVSAPVPGDNLEQLAWGATHEWGYSKHPPFPSWIVYACSRLFPVNVPVTYALAAVQVGMMLTATWSLSRHLFGPRTALASVLLVTCITFYTNRLHYYNHNTALLVATAGSALCLWRALNSRSYWPWLAVGACWGIGMLCKYQMGLPIAANLACIVAARSLDPLRRWRGLVVAGSVSASIFAPHVVWLFAHDFPPLHYAARFLGADLSFTERLVRIVKFSADQLLRLLPVIVLLIGLDVVRRRADFRSSQGDAEPAISTEVERFLAINAWGPLALMCLLSLVFGIDLEMHWGTAFLWLLPVWFMTTRRGQALVLMNPRTLLRGATVMQLLMAVVYVSH